MGPVSSPDALAELQMSWVLDHLVDDGDHVDQVEGSPDTLSGTFTQAGLFRGLTLRENSLHEDSH